MERVSAWGPAIFSDDTAADIRGNYRERLEDQVPDDEAAQRVIESYLPLDEDEKHVLWLALAATQSALGRLSEDVKARALQVIDDGVGLELWEEAGAKDLQKRKLALAKLRNQLVAPQPTRKTVRRPWRHETDLRAGDVLTLGTSRGELALLRVLHVDDERVGAAPIVSWLDWRGVVLPTVPEIDRLPVRPISWSGPRGRLETFRVSRHRKKDPDWSDVGFTLAAHVPPRPEDAGAPGWTYLGWPVLVAHMERLLER